MSFISGQKGYALGTVKCASGRCISVARTGDGGVTWSQVKSPAQQAGSVNVCPGRGPCVSQVRFATPLIGYAFGPFLFMTTDGGTHWRQLRGLSTTSLEAAGGATGTAIRVASAGQGCSGEPYKVQAALVGTSTWHLVPAPPVVRICPPTLYRLGSRLALVSYGNPAGGVRATAAIEVSGNGGSTWQGVTDKCGGKDGYAAQVTIAQPHVLVLLCRNQLANSGTPWVRVSTDDGAAFGPDRPVAAPHGLPAKSAFGYQVAAASASRLVVVATGAHSSKVYVSQNGGKTWTTDLSVPGGGNIVLAGFQDSLTARIAQGDRIWTTVSGGKHWILHQFGK